jgi:hypothetical protein
MIGSTVKQRVLEAIERLPPDATMEDAVEQLCFSQRSSAVVANSRPDKALSTTRQSANSSGEILGPLRVDPFR